jgi:sugar lactone lactonase YvrE
MSQKCVLLAATAILSVVLPAGAADHSRPIGDSNFIAAVPFPGYPEGIAVGKKNFYVAGPAAFGVASQAVVWVYDLKSGALVKTIPIGGFAGSCIALDQHENLYVIEVAQGVLKVNPETGAKTVYSSGFFPAYDLNRPNLLNDLAFDKAGNLYVTDSFQATIWRIPSGGGAPQVWFQNAILDGAFGPNGIRLDKEGKKIYFTTTFDGNQIGKILTLPVKNTPVESDLKVFYVFSNQPYAGPDGIAFGESGNLYVALAGYSAISVISEHGVEVNRFFGPAKTAGAPLPWTNPANIAFNDKTGALLVTNHASLIVPINTALFSVFDVYVNDTAGKLFH